MTKPRKVWIEIGKYRNERFLTVNEVPDNSKLYAFGGLYIHHFRSPNRNRN